MKLRVTDSIKINKATITKIDKEEVIVFDPIGGKIHSLNDTAAFIWQNIKGVTPIKKIIALLVKHYEVSDHKATTDTLDFLQSYYDDNLIA